jgi:membrane peptidoglycan carboxypeptidase
VQHNDWGFFCDMFKSWWMRQPGFGSSAAERLERLRRGGYRIVTTFDPAVQASAMSHILAKEKSTSSHALGMVALVPGTGQVRAMAVNRVYSLDQSPNGPHSDPALRRRMRGNYPDTVNPLLGGGDLPGYQAGSTFKVFTMLAALEQGLTLSTSFYAPEKYPSIYLSGPSDPKRCGIHWCPENASASMTGRQTIWSGFGKSVNTFWVQVEQKVGAQNAVRMAERLGLTWHTDIDRLQASAAKARTWGAFTLGVADTTPLEMADAYATLVADGLYCEPLPVLSVTGLDGSPVSSVVQPRCHQAVSVAVARGAVDAARCVTGYGAATGDCGGWSTGPTAYRTVGRPVAGKTGTTDDNRSAWFIGMTPGLTVAGFIADPDYPFHTVSHSDHDKPIKSVTETMRDALTGTPIRYFTAPPPEIVGKSHKRPAHAR